MIPGDGCMELVNQGPAGHPYPMMTGVSTNLEAIKHGMQTGGLPGRVRDRAGRRRSPRS